MGLKGNGGTTRTGGLLLPVVFPQSPMDLTANISDTLFAVSSNALI